MKTLEHYDIEGDILEDPIKIVFETDKFTNDRSGGPEIRSLECVFDFKKRYGVDIVENSDSCIFQSSRQIFPTPESDYKTKQAVVKIVDYNKYPWYYSKYTELLQKKQDERHYDINLRKKNSVMSNMQPNKVKRDGECEKAKQKKVSPKITSDISVKIKYDNVKKVWIVENKQDCEKHKRDIDIRKAINQRNENMIDFKRNTGLVGLTVKQKLIVDGGDFTSNVKKSTTEKSKYIKSKNKITLGEGKCGSHEEKNKKYTNSMTKHKIGPKRRVHKTSTNSVLNNRDKTTQTVNLTCTRKINHDEKSDQLISNYTNNCSNVSILQNNLSHQNLQVKQLLDKPPLSPPITNIMLDRPGPKCKKISFNKSVVKADIDKRSNKLIETIDTSNAAPLNELCSLSNTPKLGNSVVVNAKSGINSFNIPKASPSAKLGLSSNTSKLISKGVINENFEINVVNIPKASSSAKLGLSSNTSNQISKGVVNENSEISVVNIPKASSSAKIGLSSNTSKLTSKGVVNENSEISVVNIPKASSSAKLGLSSNTSKLTSKGVVNENSEINVVNIPKASSSAKLGLSTNTSKLTSKIVVNENSEMNVANIPNVSSSITSVSPSNKSELENNEVVNEISKLEVILSTREPKKTKYSIPPPNYNNTYKDLYPSYTNVVSQASYWLPIHQLPDTNRLNFVNNLSYESYNMPPNSQDFSWQPNAYNNHMNFNFKPQATYDQPPPPLPPHLYYPYHIQPIREPPPRYVNIIPVHYCPIRNTNNAGNMNNVTNPVTRNTSALKSITTTKTTYSYSSNDSIPIHSQGVTTEAQNNIKNVTKSENLKRSYVGNENSNNAPKEKPETLNKKTKLGEPPKVQSKDANKRKKQELTKTAYSPPILPIPNYDTIFSLLRLKDVIYVKSRCWRMSDDDDADSPEYVNRQDKIITPESDCEKNVTDTKTNKVKKISLEEYKRRALCKQK